MLFVNNVEELRQFYVDFFKLNVIEEIDNDWVLLSSGNMELGLHKAGNSPGTNNEDGHSNNCKIIFDIDEDIFTAHKTLKDNGVRMRDVKTWDGAKYWFCDGQDPEGNVFQLRMKKR